MRKWIIGVVVILFIGSIGYVIYREKKFKEKVRNFQTIVNTLQIQKSQSDSTAVSYKIMVDQYSSSQKDLKKQLKELKDNHVADLADKDRRILSLSKYSIALKSQIDTLIPKIKVTDSSLHINVMDYYPDKEDYFVRYEGYVHLDLKGAKNNSYVPVLAREFSFRPMDINVVLTEDELGGWNSYVDAPNFIRLKSIQVKSLPAEQYVPTVPRIKMLLGAGIGSIYGQGSYMFLSGGVRYKKFNAVLSAGLRSTNLSLLWEFSH